MIYLDKFVLPEEYDIICHKMNIYNNHYPCGIFEEKSLTEINFEDITIFYGNNGSGKTTLLNVIANKIRADKQNVNDIGPLFDTYVGCCKYRYRNTQFTGVKLILSDDVFDQQLELRAVNSNINRRKDKLIEDYYDYKNKVKPSEVLRSNNLQIMQDKIDTDHMTVSKYVRKRLGENTYFQQSNGQQALDYWQKEITENSIYLIDEPENSLSAQNQLILKQFIEDSARFFHCQFIIATHSPFFLALNRARIYDLDSNPVVTKKWTELENVKAYYQLFQQYDQQLKEEEK